MKRLVNSSQTSKNRLNYESSTNVIEAKKNIIRYKETITPDAELTARYEERYQNFHEIVKTIIPLY